MRVRIDDLLLLVIDCTFPLTTRRDRQDHAARFPAGASGADAMLDRDTVQNLPP